MRSRNCTTLKTVKFSDNVITVGYGAFKGCTSLANLTLSQNLTTLEDYAFSGCSSLANVVLPNSLTTMKSCAFNGTAISSITIPEGVTELYAFTFMECPNLKTVNLPDSLTRLGKGDFAYCPSLVEITLPSKLEYIGEQTFCASSNLESVLIPKSVTTIHSTAFVECDNVVLTVYPDSYGLQFAVDNGLNYELYRKELFVSNTTIAAIPDYTYTGSAIMPKPTVKVANGDGTVTTLVSGTDFTYSYSDNTKAGKATVRINGMNNYTGSVVAYFNILPVDISKATITLEKNEYTYTGSEIRPSIVSVAYNGKTLTENTDYVVGYSDNLDVGDRASVDIQGINNYTGMHYAYFSIVSEDLIYYLEQGGDQEQWITYTKEGIITGIGYTPKLLDYRIEHSGHAVRNESCGTWKGLL